MMGSLSMTSPFLRPIDLEGPQRQESHDGRPRWRSLGDSNHRRPRTIGAKTLRGPALRRRRNEGLPVIIHPETGTIQLGTTEAPFAVSDLPAGDDFELRIFIDKYLVEVFVCDRQAVWALIRTTRLPMVSSPTPGGPTRRFEWSKSGSSNPPMRAFGSTKESALGTGY